MRNPILASGTAALVPCQAIRADKGGATKFGVTFKTLGEFRKPGRHATPEEVEALEELEAREIYRFLYVMKCGFNRTSDDRLRVIAVDAGVLHGQGTAILILQRTLGVPADGVLGSQTLAAAAARPTVAADMVRARASSGAWSSWSARPPFRSF